MKPLPILATGLLAVLMVLGPTAAFAASTVTVTPSQSSYSGSASITLSGSVTPTPTISTSVVVTVKNPSGTIVDLSSNAVSTTTGTYSHTLVAGGTSAWVTGTYSVNATWGGSGSTASAVTTFTYTASGVVSGAAVTPYLVVKAEANSPVWPGQTEQLAVLVQWNNGSLACNNPCFATVHFYTPAGTLVTIYNPSNSSTNPITVHRGFFIWTWTLPSSYGDGLYAIHAWASLTSGGVTYQGQGLTAFTINTAIANNQNVNAVGAKVDSVSSAVAGLSSSVSSLSTQVGTLATSVSGIQTSIGTVQTGVNQIQTALGTSLGDIKTGIASISSSLGTLTTTVNSVQSSVATIQSNIGTLMSDISTLMTAVTSLSGLSSQIASLNSAISSNQTYVLVVAALAAITLVLELAILVRKLS